MVKAPFVADDVADAVRIVVSETLAVRSPKSDADSNAVNADCKVVRLAERLW